VESLFALCFLPPRVFHVILWWLRLIYIPIHNLSVDKFLREIYLYILVLLLRSEFLHSRFLPKQPRTSSKSLPKKRWPRKSRRPFTTPPRLRAKPPAPMGHDPRLLTTDCISSRTPTPRQHKNSRKHPSIAVARKPTLLDALGHQKANEGTTGAIWSRARADGPRLWEYLSGVREVGIAQPTATSLSHSPPQQSSTKWGRAQEQQVSQSPCPWRANPEADRGG